jgi:hypothetical protein
MAEKTKNVVTGDNPGLQSGEPNTGAAPTTPTTEELQQKNVENQQGKQDGNSEQKSADKSTEVGVGNKEKTVGKKGNNAKYSEIGQIAGSIFKNHPNKNVLYFTADKIPFFDKNDALRHSFSLSDKTIKEVKS